MKVRGSDLHSFFFSFAMFLRTAVDAVNEILRVCIFIYCKGFKEVQ